MVALLTSQARYRTSADSTSLFCERVHVKAHVFKGEPSDTTMQDPARHNGHIDTRCVIAQDSLPEVLMFRPSMLPPSSVLFLRNSKTHRPENTAS
jgi:hypothetical protein